MSQPVQVALVITELDVGGAEQCLVNIATGLDPAQFAVQVYALGPPPENDSLPARLREANIPTHFLHMRSAKGFFQAVRRLKAKLSEQRPALVQSFLFHAYVVGSLAAARISPRPVILGGVRVADPARCRMWLERRAAGRMDRVVCVSRSVAEFVRAHWKVPADKVVAIPNGIDMRRFPEMQMVQGSAAEGLLFIGRLHEQKGLDWLLPLMSNWVTGRTELTLRLVGEGPQRQALQQIVEEHALQNHIEFLGWRGDVDNLVAGCSILVLPSRWEGMPNVVLEAMAAGKPVLATRAEGVVELLGDAFADQTVEQGNDEAFRDLLFRMLDDESLRRRLGEQNRQRVKSRFSLAAVVQEYARLFASLVGELPSA